MCQTRKALFVSLRSSHNVQTRIVQCEYVTINDESIDGVLRSRTRSGRMEGVDESTELWRHPYSFLLFIN